MVYKCEITAISSGENKKAIPYTYFSNEKQIGRVVLTKKISGKWKDWYLLSNVVIYSEFRGFGFCGKMLKCILKKNSDKKIYLQVHETNIPAIKCYTKCGFRIYDKLKKYVLMIK